MWPSNPLTAAEIKIFFCLRAFKESRLLMLNSKKAKKELNWSPRLTFEETIKMTVDWYKELLSNPDLKKQYSMNDTIL